MKKIILLAAIAVAVTGCQNLESKPPECGSQETISLVKKLFAKTVSSQWEGGREGGFTLNLSNIRTTGYDQEAKRYTCAADASVSFMIEEGSMFGSQADVEQTIAQAQKNIAKYHEIRNNLDQVEMQYGQVMAAAYENSLSETIGSFGVGFIPKVGNTRFAQDRIENGVQFTSTIAQDESGKKTHFVEDTGGMAELAAAYPVIVSTAVVMYRARQTQ